MAELFYIALGFGVATFLFHKGFRNWITSKLKRKKPENVVTKEPEKKPEVKKNDNKDEKHPVEV